MGITAYTKPGRLFVKQDYVCDKNGGRHARVRAFFSYCIFIGKKYYYPVCLMIKNAAYKSTGDLE